MPDYPRSLVDFQRCFPMTRPAPTTSPLCAGPTAFPARPVATPRPGAEDQALDL